MSQKLPLDSFIWVEKTSQFNEDFIKSYKEDSDEWYFLEVDLQYLQEFHKHQNDLPFLPKEPKLRKAGKLSANHLYDKKECYKHKIFKQALNHGLV